MERIAVAQKYARLWVAVCLTLAVAACAMQRQPDGPAPGTMAHLAIDRFITSDGTVLPLKVWLAHGEEKAVFIAVHGFGDYSRNFELPAPWWAGQGITTYAYDQRGFGAGPRFGIWPGEGRLAGDLLTLADLVRNRHPGRRLVIVGASMGAAVALAGAATAPAGFADGLVLVAPAARTRATMGPIASGALWLAAHIMPWNVADGSGLGIQVSDNVALLKILSRDPLMYRGARVDTVYGLVDLMDAAAAAAERSGVPALILYGARDQVIPPDLVEGLVARMAAPHRTVRYPEGWHLLLRDQQAEVVWRDIASWVEHPDRPLPSGLEAPRRRASLREEGNGP